VYDGAVDMASSWEIAPDRALACGGRPDRFGGVSLISRAAYGIGGPERLHAPDMMQRPTPPSGGVGLFV
jgi:hypothetical protein